MSSIEEAFAQMGGKWVKLTDDRGELVVDEKTGKPVVIDGTIVSIVKRDRTDPNGNTVYKRGTQDPRQEMVLTYKVTPVDAEDDGLRKFAANESAQRALRDAWDKAKRPTLVGCNLKFRVSEKPATKFDQASYVGQITPGIVFDDEVPF